MKFSLKSIKEAFIQRADAFLARKFEERRDRDLQAADAFFLAVESGDVQSLEKAVSQIGPFTAEVGLVTAAEKGHMNVVQWLIAHKVSPYAAYRGTTAVEAARKNEHADIADFLQQAQKGQPDTSHSTQLQNKLDAQRQEFIRRLNPPNT